MDLHDELRTANDAIRCVYLARMATQRGDSEAAQRWQEKADRWLEKNPTHRGCIVPAPLGGISTTDFAPMAD